MNPQNPTPLEQQPSQPEPIQPAAPEPMRPAPQSKRGAFHKFRGVSSSLLLIIAAPILALFLTAHVFQPYEVDGISMETTLQNADRLIVNKFPKTISNLTRRDLSLNRWDVIVFDKPKSLSASSATEHLIKRVIGLPGERVAVRDGTVTIYNKDNPNGFDPDAGQEYSKDILESSGNVDITVGLNEVFVMGDNRSNSTDSRVFGAISTDIVVGVAIVRFVPVNTMKKL
jgi:signal peptidase I